MFLNSEINPTASYRVWHLKDPFEADGELGECKFCGEYYAKHFAITIERYYNVAMSLPSSQLRAMALLKAIRAEMRTGHPAVTD